MLFGLKDYSAQSEGSLHFKKGDLICVLNAYDEGRWFGLHKRTGEKGYFPRTHVTKWHDEE